MILARALKNRPDRLPRSVVRLMQHVGVHAFVARCEFVRKSLKKQRPRCRTSFRCLRAGLFLDFPAMVEFSESRDRSGKSGFLLAVRLPLLSIASERIVRETLARLVGQAAGNSSTASSARDTSRLHRRPINAYACRASFPARISLPRSRDGFPRADGRTHGLERQ